MKRKKTGGRKTGTPNKATADVKAAAQQYGAAAIDKLAALAGLTGTEEPSATDAVKLGALRELLDRAFGKPTQTIAGDSENPLAIIHEAARSFDAKMARLFASKRATEASSDYDSDQTIAPR